MRSDFTINDQVGGYPVRTVETSFTGEEIAAFLRDGYLPRKGLIGAEIAAQYADAILRLAKYEEDQAGAEYLTGKSIYIRGLIDKDEIFHPLLRLEPILSMARTLLGPQVWIDLEARMNYEGVAEVAVPWHGHLPVIPDPLPPLFCFPHQVHCLIYLDRISDREGAFCVLPGSHMDPQVRIPLRDQSDRDGEARLYFEPGDAVLIHANLWHRSIPSHADAGPRRLLLMGYVPSWIRQDIGEHGVKAVGALRAGLASRGDAETRELLGEFNW
jgi:hypothetical protein